MPRKPCGLIGRRKVSHARDPFCAACDDANACTIGDSCQSGGWRRRAPRDCGPFRLIGVQCRPSDGACCGRPGGGLLPGITVCRK